MAVAAKRTFQKLAPGASVRLTQMGTSHPVCLEAIILGVEDDNIHIRLTQENANRISQLRYLHEFLMRWENERPVDTPMVVIDIKEKTNEMILLHKTENLREYQRVESPIPVSYEILSTDEEYSDALQLIDRPVDNELERNSEGSPILTLARKVDHLSQRIEEELAEMNEKLNYLVALAQGQKVVLKQKLKGKMIDLSGSGFSFTADTETISEGTKLKVIFDISMNSFQKVHCIGEVARIMEDKETNGKVYGMHILAISESDRDKIVKYVFSVHRRILRLHREIN